MLTLVTASGCERAHRTGPPGRYGMRGFWPLLFNNVVIRLLRSDDFAAVYPRRAAADLVTCLAEGLLTIDVTHRFSLDEIAEVYEAVERPTRPGRVIVAVD
jgi:NADPH2:quinone reductase